MDIHDPQAHMGLAGMVVTRSHQPAGPRILRHHAAAAANSEVDIIEDFCDLWTTFEWLSHSVRHVPNIDRRVNQLGYFGFVGGRDFTKFERVHNGSYMSLVDVIGGLSARNCPRSRVRWRSRPLVRSRR